MSAVHRMGVIAAMFRAVAAPPPPPPPPPGPSGIPLLLGFGGLNSGLVPETPVNRQPLPSLSNFGDGGAVIVLGPDATPGVGWVPYLGPPFNDTDTAMTTFLSAGDWDFNSVAVPIAFGAEGDIDLPELHGAAPMAGFILTGGAPNQFTPAALIAGAGFTYSFDWRTNNATLPFGNEWGMVTPIVGASVGIPLVDSAGGDILQFGFQANSVYDPSGTLPPVERHFIKLLVAGTSMEVSGFPLNTSTHTLTLTITSGQDLASLYVDGVLAGTLAIPTLPPPAKAVYVQAGVSWPSFVEAGFPSGPTAGLDNLKIEYGELAP